MRTELLRVPSATYRPALDALDRAGVGHCVRNDPHRIDAPEPGGDLDVIVDPGNLRGVDAALGTAGYRPFTAPGHPGHRFYLSHVEGWWLKLDVLPATAEEAGILERRHRWEGVWVASPSDQEAHAELRASGTDRRRGTWGRRRPAAVRRLGPLIAVLGPDGAGKGTILDALEERIPVGVTRIYLGSRARGSSADATGVTPHPAREAAFLLRKALRAAGVLARGYAAAWRGHIVLCDRHPIEALAIRPPRTPLGARLERFLMGTMIPSPDAVLLLDAPTDVLVARKDEHPPERIDRWREAYRRTFPTARLIRTDRPIDESVDDASTAVWELLEERRGWR